jgi:hypothetical protein
VRVFALIGDSSAVVDAGNRRLLLIDPRGRTSAIAPPAGAPCQESIPSRVGAIDGTGRVYSTVPAPDPESDAIVRMTPGACGRDTVGIIPASITGARLLEGRVRVGGTLPPPLSPSVEWAVARDGRIAIAYPQPYHVVFVQANGARRTGSAIAHEPIRLSEAHKQSWRDEQRRPRLVTMVGLGGSGGTEARYMSVPTLPEPARWPALLPPFLEGALTFAPDGTLWIQRTTAADASPIFDLVDEGGQVTRIVQLPGGRRLVGLGVDWVYAVRRDELDLEHLERYRLPR